MAKRYQEVARALADEGVTDAFGVMGVGNLDLLLDLVNVHGVRYHAARIEGGAVSMAEAWARVGGGVGVCAVTQGPGLTNAITALTAATRAGGRLLLITGDMPAATPRGTSQQIDHAALIAPTGAAFCAPGPDEDWYRTTRECVQAIRGTGRPAVLNLANDLQPGEVADGPHAVADAESAARAEPEADVVDPELIAQAARLLRAARRPLVLAGRGAIDAGAQVAELARRADALLGTTVLAKDLFVDDPWSIGIIGGFASRAARRALVEVDCVVSLGAGLNRWTTKDGSLLAGRTHVHCDLDPAAVARQTGAAVALVGDAGIVAAALAQALGEPPDDRPVTREPGLAELLHAAPNDDVCAPGARGLHPRAALRRIDALLPRDRVVITDGGHFVGFPAAELAVRRPRDFVFTQNFGTIGLGVGAAVGAAVAAPDRLCVLVAGDGGFSMSIADLETAVRLGVSLLIVVINDGGYGAEFHAMTTHGQPIELATFDNPDFAAVARGYGAAGHRVQSLADLDEALRGVGAGSGVTLLDVIVDPTVVDRWMSDRFPAGDPRKEPL